MAEKTTSTAQRDDTELDDLAFQIFCESVAGRVVKRGGEQQARESYTKAKAFLAVREKVRSGELDVEQPTGPQLANCCCPNQPKSHPFNLVSQQMGDLSKVNRIAKFLQQNPPSVDRREADVAASLNRQIPDLNWTDEQVKTARAIFPAYVTN